MASFIWPVQFVNNVSRQKPTPFVLRNKKYVLWWNKGKVVCAPDVCPHRLSMLSTGEVVDGTIECRYHNWRFDGTGTCTTIPQIASSNYPKACNLEMLPVHISDNIVWVTEGEPERAVGTPTNILAGLHPFDISTDTFMQLKNSYRLQIENNLDVSHLHTVHDGFQGSKTRISPISCSQFYEDETIISGYFEHESDTPDMEMIFLKPGSVIVKVLHKKTKQLLRTNVINCSPETNTSCNLMFRDISHYDGTFFDPAIYSFINKFIISEIFKQDIAVLADQQSNASAPDYSAQRYCLPAPGDRAIAAFRRWCRDYNIL